jgi:hypothetical protein
MYKTIKKKKKKKVPIKDPCESKWEKEAKKGPQKKKVLKFGGLWRKRSHRWL